MGASRAGSREVGLVVAGLLVAACGPGLHAWDGRGAAEPLGFGGAEGEWGHEVPALTPEMAAEMAALTEHQLNLRFTRDERREFESILARYWLADGGKLARSAPATIAQYRELMDLPEATRSAARRSVLLPVLLQMERDAAQGDESSVLLLRAYQRAHPPVRPDVPTVSAEIADVFIEAFAFVNEIKSGQPAPRLTEAQRRQMRVDVAGDIGRLGDDGRQALFERVGRATNLMINWPRMDELERLLARAEVGARLSPSEQAMAQQARHALQGHAMGMLSRELNFMARSQQDIMGSAPYWNPASQSWEQKGGIVTEFR